MEIRAGDIDFHYADHGEGMPVLVLHGAGVDHREPEACFENGLARPGFRRVYPDLPGMGRTPAPASLDSAEGVVDALLGFAEAVIEGGPFLVAGHSAGAYFARAMAARQPSRVLGLALVCPLLPGIRDVPEHRRIAGSGDLGDDVFRNYFVVQTPAMLDRYERFVAPSAALVDEASQERIGAHWELPLADPYPGPTLVVAGRLDSTVGSAVAVDLLDEHPRATLAVLDDAGHALPHEKPELLGALLADWLTRAQCASSRR